MKSRITSIYLILLLLSQLAANSVRAEMERLSVSGVGAHTIFEATENGILTTAEVFVSVPEDTTTPFVGLFLKQVDVATGQLVYDGQGQSSSIDFAIGPDFESGHLNAYVQAAANSNAADVRDVHLVINWVGSEPTEALSGGNLRIELEDGTLTERHAGYVRMLDTAGSIKISNPANNNPTLTLPPSETPSIAWSSSSTGKLVTKSGQTSQSFKPAIAIEPLATSSGSWSGYWVWNWNGTKWVATWVWVWNSGSTMVSVS